MSAEHPNVKSDSSAARSMPPQSETWDSIWDAIRIPLAPLASLRLTVALLALSVFVVLVATLEQTESDIWTVKYRHYSSLFVSVPVQIFFPPDWFPNWQNVPFSIVIPSGFAMLLALIVNLVAAHVLRMRVQARGWRMGAGLGVFGAGVATCWLVVFGAQNPEGFQGEPPISYHVLWQWMQIGMLGLAIGGLIASLGMRRLGALERILLGAFSAIVTAVLAVTLVLGERAFIGDSGMRVLWQLLQATVAALVLWGGCVLLFKRKGGIVLLHCGLGLLMVNELYVTLTNVEQQIVLLEGQTAWHAIDIRETELVVADDRNPQAVRMVIIPGHQLRQGGRIADPRLPFDVEVIEYLGNVAVEARRPGETTPATAGLGMRDVARAIPAFTDADKRVNFAATYVKLWDRAEGRSLGTYLLSQDHYESRELEAVDVAGVVYRVGLRFRHHYKPYSVTLVDAQRKLYLGTDRPKWYASEILINDPTIGLVDHPQRVWMNNPLRFRDETFYQTGWNEVPSPTGGTTEMSILQVVKNRGWMIPYLACMIVVVGLVAQFGSVLLSYLEKRQRAALRDADSKSVSRRPDVSKPSPLGANGSALNGVAWVAAGVVLSACLAMLAREWSAGMRRIVVGDSVDVSAWGQLPVNYGARVQPLDSLARNTVRQLSNSEFVKDRYGKRQPAIRWLADWVFEAPGHDEYALIRITDLNVLDAIGLNRKPGFRYSMAELTAKPTGDSGPGSDPRSPLERLGEITRPLVERDRKDLTAEQSRLIDLQVQVNRLTSLRRALGGDPYLLVAAQHTLHRLEMASMLARETHLPRLVPIERDAEQPWRILTHYWTERWFATQAQELQATTVRELAEQITRRDVVAPLRENMIREAMIDLLLADERTINLFQEQWGVSDRRRLRQMLAEQWDQFPKSVYEAWLPQATEGVNRLIEERLEEFVTQVEGLIREPTGWSSADVPQVRSDYARALMEMGAHYRAGDGPAFGEAVRRCTDYLAGHGGAEYQPSRVRTELIYNGFSPLYQATVLYLVALALAALGWAFWGVVWNRASSTVLLLALGVHVAAIVMRVIISGRPPVTTLYSSFVFVPIVTVSLLWVIERWTRMGVAHFLAGLSGAAALMWAWSITVSDQNSTGDTFTVMEAVLDTQFWLSTHVIMILVGYGGTMLAGLLGAAYLILAIFTPVLRGQREQQLASVIYGAICFALLFSFFGTVLGGLWADDSWGRFWGWDPKENGALMIVLWNAVGLHARWGGIVKHRGLAGLAVLGSIVTIWSWEGVNQLGQGLHSYGFSQDRLFGVGIFVAVHLVLAALALIPPRFWLFRRPADDSPVRTG